MEEIVQNLTSEERRIIASLPGTEYWIAIAKFISLSLEADRKIVREAAKLCNEPLCEDLRWKLGGISKLEELEKLPQTCDKILTRERRKR